MPTKEVASLSLRWQPFIEAHTSPSGTAKFTGSLSLRWQPFIEAREELEKNAEDLLVAVTTVAAFH